MPRSLRIALSCSALLGAISPSEALSAMDPSTSRLTSVMKSPVQQESSSRREWIGQIGGMATLVASIASTTTATVGFPQGANAAASDEYLAELKDSLSKIQPIPKLLEEQKWDEARTILKNPPVNKLWNLGDGQNTVLKLVKETGNVELFEIKDDLAYNLQMCDQLTYNNNFIYFQPGNGKLDLKGPVEAINKALKQLDTIITESS